MGESGVGSHVQKRGPCRCEWMAEEPQGYGDEEQVPKPVGGGHGDRVAWPDQGKQRRQTLAGTATDQSGPG